MLRFPLASTLLLIFLATAPTSAAQVEQHRVVARIGPDSVTVERFNATYVQRLIQTGRNDTPQERYAHLNDLIDTHLLAEEARERGLEDAAYQEYIDMEIRKIVGGRFFEIAFADSFPDPSESDVLEAFRRTKEEVVLRHLFFQHPDSARAAYERLEKGADFLQLANEVFDTASFDSAAGLLGNAGYWDLDDAVAEAAWELNLNEHSEPVRSKYGWHILRVEDLLRNPILTEEEFQRRREDLKFRVRARRFRLEGSRFVRTFMDSLDVEVAVDGMTALREAVVREIEPDDAQPPRPTIGEEEVAAVSEELSPETVLATYEFDGRREAFTAGQYFEWMSHLPAGEIRNRTAGSVGRALRNQVLADRGLSMGLQNDQQVRDEVEYRASEYLAGALRDRLRLEAETIEPTEAELREAFDRLRFKKLEKATADFWHLQFETMREAQAAKNAIAAGEAEADTFASFAKYDDTDLRPMGELGTYIQKAPLETPVVIGTGDGGWHVVQIAERTIEYTTFEEAREEVDRAFRPYLPEMRLLRTLRKHAEADVEIDLELFEEMMLLGRTPPKNGTMAPVKDSLPPESMSAPKDDVSSPDGSTSAPKDVPTTPGRSDHPDTHPGSRG